MVSSILRRDVLEKYIGEKEYGGELVKLRERENTKDGSLTLTYEVPEHLVILGKVKEEDAIKEITLPPEEVKYLVETALRASIEDICDFLSQYTPKQLAEYYFIIHPSDMARNYYGVYLETLDPEKRAEFQEHLEALTQNA